jgi:hypothetical protein
VSPIRVMIIRQETSSGQRCSPPVGAVASLLPVSSRLGDPGRDGSNPLWIAEWLSDKMDLRAGAV